MCPADSHPAAAAIIGSRLYRLDRNKTILCGIGKCPSPVPRSARRSTCHADASPATGVLVGYQFTQIFLASNLARLRTEQAQLAQANDDTARPDAQGSL